MRRINKTEVHVTLNKNCPEQPDHLKVRIKANSFDRSHVLITGGAGFIGSHLCNKLISDGHRVTIIDSLVKEVHGPNPVTDSYSLASISPKATLIIDNIINIAHYHDQIKDCNIIYHLASQNGTAASLEQMSYYCEENILGTARILDYLDTHKTLVKKFILSSSRAIYGEGEYESPDHGKVPCNRSYEQLKSGDFTPKCPYSQSEVILKATNENVSARPISVYGLTKYTQEKLIEFKCMKLNIQPIILRFQNVYGPGQSLSNSYTGIIGIFYNQLKSNRKIKLYEQGLPVRDFVHVYDIVQGLLQSLNYNGKLIAFNLGYGEAIDLINLAETMISIIGKGSYDRTNMFRIGDVFGSYADINMAKKHLKYSPLWPLKSGLENYLIWADSISHSSL